MIPVLPKSSSHTVREVSMLTLKSRSSGKTMGDRHDDMTSCPQLRIVSADASPSNHGSRTPIDVFLYPPLGPTDFLYKGWWFRNPVPPAWDVCNPLWWKPVFLCFISTLLEPDVFHQEYCKRQSSLCDFFWCQRRCNHIAVIGYVTTLEVPGFKLSLFCCSVARGCEVVVKSASVLQEQGITRTGTQTIFRELNLERLLRKKAHLDR